MLYLIFLRSLLTQTLVCTPPKGVRVDFFSSKSKLFKRGFFSLKRYGDVKGVREKEGAF